MLQMLSEQQEPVTVEMVHNDRYKFSPNQNTKTLACDIMNQLFKEESNFNSELWAIVDYC